MSALEMLAGELLDALVHQLHARPDVADQLRSAIGTGPRASAMPTVTRPASADGAAGLPRSVAASSSTIATPDAIASQAAVVGEITTAALARLLGKSNARAARDWCKSHGVPYRRDGKYSWVSVADVRRTLDALPMASTKAPRAVAINNAVARITARGKR